MRAYQSVDNGLLSTGIGPTRVAAPANFTTMIAMVARHPNAALLRALNAGPKRFNELLAEVQSVPELAVSGCLRDLDSDGLVARKVDPGPPLRVLYELTPRGQALMPALLALADWTER